MSTSVSSITAVRFYITGAEGGSIVLLAWGTAPTPNWTSPVLLPRSYVATPDDGIQDFDFVADKPGGLHPQVITPISTHFAAAAPVGFFWGEGKPLNGVRIHSASGFVVAYPEVTTAGITA